MHAILKGQDEKLHWTEVADPTLREDDVLLEIHAAALNRADLLQRAGQYPPPPGWPEWYGLEAEGVIRALGAKAQAERSRKPQGGATRKQAGATKPKGDFRPGRAHRAEVARQHSKRR